MHHSKSLNQKPCSIDKDRKANLTTYILKKVGSKLIGENFGFILSTRAKVTKKKTKHFLLNLKDRVYISSLYATNTKDTYKFDYKSKGFTLLLDLDNGNNNVILTAL